MTHTDDELLYLIHQNQESAVTILAGKYEPLLQSMAKGHLRTIGCTETEEAKQITRIGLAKAIGSYRVDRNCGFQHYMRVCVDRDLSSMCRTYIRYFQKIVPFSRERLLFVAEDEDPYRAEWIPSQDPFFDPVWSFMYRTYETRWDSYYESLSPKEKEIFERYQRGSSYQSIAEQMNIKPKTVDNTLQKIKRNMKRLFD